jgi:hypothetical protein
LAGSVAVICPPWLKILKVCEPAVWLTTTITISPLGLMKATFVTVPDEPASLSMRRAPGCTYFEN